MAHQYLAQSLTVGGYTVNGPLKLAGHDPNSPLTIGNIITYILTILVPIAGLILFGAIIYGGFVFLTGQGDPKKMQQGQQILTWSIAGFVLLILSFILTRVVLTIVGIDTKQTPF